MRSNPIYRCTLNKSREGRSRTKEKSDARVTADNRIAAIRASTRSCKARKERIFSPGATNKCGFLSREATYASCDKRKKHRTSFPLTVLRWAQQRTGRVKGYGFIRNCPTRPLHPGVCLISSYCVSTLSGWGHVKMARKPLKDLFDEQSELYDREFEDDAKL